MRPLRLKVGGIAVWLGVVALAVNALAPIRLVYGFAFAFADSRECGHYEGKAVAWRDPGWWALALLTGYDETRDPSRTHKGLHPAAGAIAVVIGTFAGLTPKAAAATPLPLQFAEIRLAPAAAAGAPSAAVSAAYRSRAPPKES
jgi:hypothetical protein